MIGLVTTTRNSMATLPDTLESIGGAKDRIKSIFIDGGSTDGTIDYLRSYVEGNANALLLAQVGTGLYQAINQGVQAALDYPDITHIGMLHSDDQLIPDSFERYLGLIENHPSSVFYSDIEFHDDAKKRVRVWVSDKFSNFKLHTGWMPPHTSIVVSTDVYRRVGLYNPDYGTAADYDWVVRVLSEYGEQSHYFAERTLSMLVGGASSSSLRARLRANAMDSKVWADKSKLNSILVRVCKPLRKIGQFKFI